MIAMTNATFAAIGPIIAVCDETLGVTLSSKLFEEIAILNKLQSGIFFCANEVVCVNGSNGLCCNAWRTFGPSARKGNTSN